MRDPKRPGRPALVTDGTASARVQVLLPSRDYDQALAAAKRQAVSIPELMRRGLKRVLADESAE